MILQSKKGVPRGFVIGRVVRKDPRVDLHARYELTLKKSLALSLLLITIIFLLFPKFEAAKKQISQQIDVVLDIEDIPVTRQGRRSPPPAEPAVPIPTEEESIPEDLTIEPTQLSYNYVAASEEGRGVGVTIGPRPIEDVFPEYPEEEKKKGIQGVIELYLKVDIYGNVVDVKVLRNTTNSLKLLQAAIRAAYRTKFMPARKGSQPVTIWTTRVYKFELIE